MAEEEQKFGCEHYKRKCALVSPCCKKVYACRLCHNEAESHEINRQEVTEVKCLKCETQQKVQRECEKCGTVFGQYFCAVCNLYDDEDKQQFHCSGCGICRIGGRENYYHCTKCDMCLAVSMKDAHKCVEQASHCNCPVCMEDLHTSRIPCDIPRCGHLIHRPCFANLLKTGNYACPICNVSLINMKEQWLLLDEEIENTPMPEEYRNQYLQVLCRDCHEESRTLFHVVGLKCKKCGSYNTCRAAEPDAAKEVDGKTATEQTPVGSEEDNTGDGAAANN